MKDELELYKEEVEGLKHDNYVWRNRALEYENKRDVFINWLESEIKNNSEEVEQKLIEVYEIAKEIL